MNVWVLLRLGFEAVRGSNWRFKLLTFGPSVLIFLLLLFTFPAAALIVPALWLLFFIIALIIAAFQMKQLLNIKLRPSLFRAVINRDEISRLAGELAALGFVHVGLFKVAGRDLYVEGLVRPDWKVYAMITSGDTNADAYVEFSSFYADGGAYCVSGGKTRSVLPRPANMVNIHHPGKSTEELLGIFLQGRPDYGLLDTPPDRFQETVEREIRRMGEYIFKRGRER